MTSNYGKDTTYPRRKKYQEVQGNAGHEAESLAFELGEDWTQKKVSPLESKEKIEEDILEQVARILNVSSEAIQKFSEETAMNIISNTFTSHDSSTLNAINSHCTINPIEKLMELFEENKKLYEQLLMAEKEKVKYLEELLSSKN